MACRKKLCAIVSSSELALLKCQSPVVAVGPEVIPCFSFDELRSDTDPIADLTYAAFEHITHTQLASHLFHIDRAALVGKGGVPGDYEQRGMTRERCDHVFGNAVGDELLLGVAAHVGEGQHR